jgi:hypothetical protein
MKIWYETSAQTIIDKKHSLQWWFCLVFTILTVFFSACESASDEPVRQQDYSNCRYEKPEAIFYEGLPQVTDHQFHQADGGGSQESFVLSGMVGINILQYGCDFRTQEFVFDLGPAANCEEPGDCTREVVQIMQALSRLGPEFHIFRVWAKAIKDISPQIRLGKPTEVAEGFWVKVDHKRNLGHTTLKLTLSERA